MHICICTSAQHSSTPIASISFKPLDHAIHMCSGINLLCLASTEFISIIAVHIGLCFAFVAGMVLIAHSVLATAEQWFHGDKAFFPTPGGRQEAGRVQSTSGRCWSKEHFLHSHDLVLSKESWGKGRESGAIGYHFGFPSTCTQCILRSCFPRNGWTSV